MSCCNTKRVGFASRLDDTFVILASLPPGDSSAEDGIMRDASKQQFNKKALLENLK